MATWQVILIAVVGFVGLYAVIILIARIALRRVAAAMGHEVARRFAPTSIRRKDLTANCFGRESLGLAQIRGNGALVLTHEVVWFLLAVPRRDFRIPLDAIEAVELRRRHLGKTILRDLLYVQWRSGDTTDSAAWCVPDPRAWIDAIEAERRKT